MITQNPGENTSEKQTNYEIRLDLKSRIDGG